MNNRNVIYVPIPGNTGYKYPMYVPIIVNEPDVYKSTGRLSAGDYKASVNNLAGFPAILPLLAALAPLVPIAVKGAQKLFGRKSHGVAGYIPTNPNIKTLKDIQALYDKYD